MTMVYGNHKVQVMKGKICKVDLEVVHIECLENKTQVAVKLQGVWAKSIVAVGYDVHLIGKTGFFTGEDIVLNETTSDIVLVVLPNMLVSSTIASSAHPCLRKAYIDQVYQGTELNEAILVGHFTHEVFQKCLYEKDFSMRNLWIVARQLVKQRLVSLFDLGIDERSFLQNIAVFLRNFHQWSKDFFSSEKSTTKIKVWDVHDIEETVWSPAFGLKGKIDVTIKAQFPGEEKIHTCTPFELKSGSNLSMQHVAQVMLYCVMFYAEKGILLYFKENTMNSVEIVKSHLDALIVLRNNLAVYQSVRSESQQDMGRAIPPIEVSRQICERCYAKSECMILHEIYGDGNNSNLKIVDLCKDETDHLTDEDHEYFRIWDQAIEAEYNMTRDFSSEIWDKPTLVRETKSKCMGGLVLEHDRSRVQDGKYYFTFSVHKRFINRSAKGSDHIFRESDYVYLCLDDLPEERLKGFSIWHSQIYKVSQTEVTIVRKHPLPRSIELTSALWRIDIIEEAYMFNKMRFTLMDLMKNSEKTTEKLRSLVCRLSPPSFQESISYPFPMHIRDAISGLNISQKNALELALKANDYALIQGLPGTGKSYLQIVLIQVLVCMGKSVLLTSHTNTAIDNIFEKLIATGMDSKLMRIGAYSRVSEKVRDSTCFYDNMSQFECTANLKKVLDSIAVVAVTCIGISQHLYLRHKQFDVCIADEAGQILEPVILRSLLLSESFILVGDHKQLPPLSRASNVCLKKSLFERLCTAYPNSMTQLTLQYRMNTNIAFLANALVYDHQLICGNQLVADQQFDFNTEHPDQWIRCAANPNQSVVFFDTSSLPHNAERSVNKTYINDLELSLIETLIKCMEYADVNLQDIGIISPFQGQTRALKLLITNVLSDTIDRFQGQDKRCMIISFVNSNASNYTSELLEDISRINVAITRAKAKLIMFGNVKTLKNSKVVKSLLDILYEKQWVFSIPQLSLKRPLESVLESVAKRSSQDIFSLTK